MANIMECMQMLLGQRNTMMYLLFDWVLQTIGNCWSFTGKHTYFKHALCIEQFEWTDLESFPTLLFAGKSHFMHATGYNNNNNNSEINWIFIL